MSYLFLSILMPLLLQTHCKNPYMLLFQQSGLLKWQFLLISGSKTMVVHL